jgi:hypothetical protein
MMPEKVKTFLYAKKLFEGNLAKPYTEQAVFIHKYCRIVGRHCQLCPYFFVRGI